MQIALLRNAIQGPSSSFRIIPAGKFRSIDGRPVDESAWELTPDRARQLVASASAKAEDYVIDFEHQSLNPGGPAPAAGWFKKLEWREGDGLYVLDARWTERAKAMLRSQEYRYVSPVFHFDKGTGLVNALHSLALTNTPALTGLTDLGKISINSLMPMQASTYATDGPGGISERSIEMLEKFAGVPYDQLKNGRRKDTEPTGNLTEKQQRLLEEMTGVPIAELQKMSV